MRGRAGRGADFGFGGWHCGKCDFSKTKGGNFGGQGGRGMRLWHSPLCKFFLDVSAWMLAIFFEKLNKLGAAFCDFLCQNLPKITPWHCDYRQNFLNVSAWMFAIVGAWIVARALAI